MGVWAGGRAPSVVQGHSHWWRIWRPSLPEADTFLCKYAILSRF